MRSAARPLGQRKVLYRSKKKTWDVNCADRAVHVPRFNYDNISLKIAVTLTLLLKGQHIGDQVVDFAGPQLFGKGWVHDAGREAFDDMRVGIND